MADRKYTRNVVDSVFTSDDNFDSWTTVTVDDAPHTAQFGTDTFRKKRFPVTKTGVQSYKSDGREVQMRKRRDELEKAAWSLDNAELISHAHHQSGAKSSDNVLGFVRNPQFENDKQYVDGYIPVGGRAERLIADGYTDVSVGFHHSFNDDSRADVAQTDILYDHVALCPRGAGRWSHEDGVGITADSNSFAGLTADADNHRFTEGDWVRWEFGDGSAVGRVTEWTDDGSLSVDGGSREADDERVYKMEHWDDGEFGNMTVKSDSELSEASEPDSFTSDTSKGDASDTPFDGDGDFSLERQFASDATVMDTITYEGTRDGSLDESEIPNDDFESHYVFAADTKSDSSFPLVDGDGMLRRGNVDSAWQLRGRADDESFLVDVLSSVNDEFDDEPIDSDELSDEMTNDSTMTDDDSDSMGQFFDETDLTVDALAEKHDGVAELREETDELRSDKQELEDELDELRSDKKELEAELQSYRADERESVIDDIQSLTDKWSADELQDASMDELESKRDLAEDFKNEFASDASKSDVTDFSADSSSRGRDNNRKYAVGEAHDLRDTA